MRQALGSGRGCSYLRKRIGASATSCAPHGEAAVNICKSPCDGVLFIGLEIVCVLKGKPLRRRRARVRAFRAVAAFDDCASSAFVYVCMRMCMPVFRIVVMDYFARGVFL